MPPLISILLSVHNNARQITEALGSLLSQSLGDFELVAVDDGSSDGSGEVLAQTASQDPRVKVLVNPVNLGLTRSLNRAFAAASGRLIARQDADDISQPDRLAVQSAFLDANPPVGLVGSAVQVIDEAGNFGDMVGYPASHSAICCHLPFGNPFCHSAVMFRQELIPSGLLPYDEGLPCSQDYDLWGRLLQKTRGANLPQPLVRLREGKGRISEVRRDEQRAIFARLAGSRIEELCPGLGLSARQVLALHDWWGQAPGSLGPHELDLCRVFFRVLDALQDAPGLDRQEVTRTGRNLAGRLLGKVPAKELPGAARRLGLPLGQALLHHLPRRLARLVKGVC